MTAVLTGQRDDATEKVDATKIPSGPTQEEILQQAAMNPGIFSDEEKKRMQDSMGVNGLDGALKAYFMALKNELQTTTGRSNMFLVLVRLGLLSDKNSVTLQDGFPWQISSYMLLTPKGADFLGINLAAFLMAPVKESTESEYRARMEHLETQFQVNTAWNEFFEGAINEDYNELSALCHDLPDNYGMILDFLSPVTLRKILDILHYQRRDTQCDAKCIPVFERLQTIGWISSGWRPTEGNLPFMNRLRAAAKTLCGNTEQSTYVVTIENLLSKKALKYLQKYESVFGMTE